MITGVKVIQYHLTKLEDAEKELAEVLNSGYTFLSCACSDTYVVWTLIRKEEPAGILVPNPKIISEVDDYSDDLDWSHSSPGSSASSYDIVAFQE